MRWRTARGGGECRGARAGIVGADLERPAMAVMVAADRAVLLLVRRLCHARRGRRARDIGDGRDVVPIDAVPDAER
jgi:hypothetical protein